VITVDGGKVRVSTRTLSALFENGALVSLVRKSDGREFLRRGGAGPLELVYADGGASPLYGVDGDTVACLPINDTRAEMRFHAWFGDGVVTVSEDAENGDLVVEPSAYASRPGLRAARWNIGGIDKGVELVAPFFQGIRLPLEDEIIQGKRFHWPHYWEAGLAILRGKDGGFWVHCRDDRYRFKALQVGLKGDARALGFETEGYGPLEKNLGAGGLAWRINVFEGGWQAPAAAYRDWLWKAYGLDGAARAEWLPKLRLAVAWCPTDMALLDALAKRMLPAEVLLHVPHWRSDRYDQNYPTFKASSEGAAFIARAKELGFRVMPHMNSIDMDPTHPVYAYVRDFEYREAVSKRVQGWTYINRQVRPVPESNAARLLHQDANCMVKIHPGLAMWRSILAENVANAARELALDTVFLDVTLNTWNLDNCLVDNMTPTEGMKRLIREVATIGDGLAVGGEGRNEITMQEQYFGQAHLFESWQESISGLERTGGTALNEFLFGGLCRSFGYTGLGGSNADEETRMKLHVSLGAIPTLTVHGAADVEKPNKAVTEVLDLAAR